MTFSNNCLILETLVEGSLHKSFGMGRGDDIANPRLPILEGEHMRRVTQLRQDVRRHRLKIPNLRSLLQTEDKRIFDQTEEAFRRLGEFVTERDDSGLKLASKAFILSQSSRDECGPLSDEISKLERYN